MKTVSLQVKNVEQRLIYLTVNDITTDQVFYLQTVWNIRRFHTFLVLTVIIDRVRFSHNTTVLFKFPAKFTSFKGS